MAELELELEFAVDDLSEIEWMGMWGVTVTRLEVMHVCCSSDCNYAIFRIRDKIRRGKIQW